MLVVDKGTRCEGLAMAFGQDSRVAGAGSRLGRHDFDEGYPAGERRGLGGYFPTAPDSTLCAERRVVEAFDGDEGGRRGGRKRRSARSDVCVCVRVRVRGESFTRRGEARLRGRTCLARVSSESTDGQSRGVSTLNVGVVGSKSLSLRYRNPNPRDAQKDATNEPLNVVWGCR